MGSILSALNFIDLLRRIWSGASRLRRLWKTITNNKLQTILTLLGTIGLFVLFGWALQPDKAPQWTGFGPQNSSTAARGRTLWDWFELLLVPVAIVLSVWLLKRERTVSRSESVGLEKRPGEYGAPTQDNQLRDLRDNITQLLLREGLRTSTDTDEVRKIARARLSSTVWGLDGRRKGALVRFLQDSGLIRTPRPIISLSGVDLSGAQLRGALLEKADLRFSRLSQVDFKHAMLYWADLTGADLSGGDLRASNIGVAITDKNENSPPTMRQVNLDRATISKVDLRGTDLSRASLRDAILDYAYLKNANLTNADLQGARLRQANLEEALLKESVLASAILSEAILNGAILTEAVLENADLRRLSAVRANFRSSNLRRANLRGANLMQAFLFEADLRGADLRGTILKGVNLSGADLTGARLNGSDLRGAYLSGATVSAAQLKTAKFLHKALLPDEHMGLQESSSGTPGQSNRQLAGQIAASNSAS
jgi:uncharacterized protein YjbI with pentapeptide repeats